ncbi:MAG: hypothetical protein ACYDGY_09020 [Acidimicrobiales bacterium]
METAARPSALQLTVGSARVPKGAIGMSLLQARMGVRFSVFKRLIGQPGEPSGQTKH